MSSLSTTRIDYSNKVDTNVTTENCTFIEISKILGGGGGGNYLHPHKKSPINLFFLISNPASISQSVLLSHVCISLFSNNNNNNSNNNSNNNGVMPIKLLIQSEMCCSGYFSCDCHLYVDSFPYLVTK